MADEDSSLELMSRAARGDTGSYSALVRKYGDAVRRVCYLLLHNSVAADDASQETFARALEQIGQFRGSGQPRNWFISIALNVCRRKLRDEKTHERSAEAVQLETGKRHRFQPHGILTSLVRRETAKQLAVALGFLTDDQREAFVLHYVEELPYDEIGTLLGINAAAARALAHRARVALQARLPSLGI